jgi:hypothetical protein
MLDSGSAFYGLDQAFAQRAGVSPNGRRVTVRGVQHVLRGRYGRIGTLQVGASSLADLPALVIDYASLAATVGRPVEMALGGDFFHRFVIDLDFADGSLALHDPAAFVPPPGADVVPLKPLSRLMTAPVSFDDGRTVWAIVDTGSEPPLIVSPGPARRFRLFEGRGSTAPLGGIGGASVVRVSSATRVALGPHWFEDVPIQGAAQGLGADANLGLGLLGRFHLWLDFANRRMWLKPGGETASFRRDFLGFYGEVGAQGIRVTHVAPGGPAAAAGFRAGDVVTRINGMPAAEANLLFRDARPGTALTFTLADGRTRSLTLARYY